MQTLEERQRLVRESHHAPERWYELYEELPLGCIPPPADCVNAPTQQQPLANIPNIRSRRPESIQGHFLTAKESRVHCEAVLEDGNVCGATYSIQTSWIASMRHIRREHPSLYRVVQVFRFYQRMILGETVPGEAFDQD